MTKRLQGGVEVRRRLQQRGVEEGRILQEREVEDGRRLQQREVEDERRLQQREFEDGELQQTRLEVWRMSRRVGLGRVFVWIVRSQFLRKTKLFPDGVENIYCFLNSM